MDTLKNKKLGNEVEEVQAIDVDEMTKNELRKTHDIIELTLQESLEFANEVSIYTVEEFDKRR